MPLDERLYRIDEDPAGSDTVWFVFSARSVPLGKFSMTGATRELPGDKVFFNCRNNSWFLDVEADIDALIGEILARKPYARRLFLGTSMGGAGALMFAARHDATRLLAFSLNTLVGERFTHSALYVKHRERDLLQDLPAGFAARCTAILGAFDPADAETARRLARARVDTRLVRSNHDTAGFLARLDQIQPLLQQFERGEQIRLPAGVEADREELRLSHAAGRLLARIDEAGRLEPAALRTLARLDQRFAKEILRKLAQQEGSDHRHDRVFDYALAAIEAGLAYDFLPGQLVNAAFRLRDERCRTAAFYLPAFLEGPGRGERARMLAHTVARIAADADAAALIEDRGAIDHLAALAARAGRAGSHWAALDLVRRIPRLSRGPGENFVAARAAAKLGRTEEALGFARAAAKASPREARYAALVERLVMEAGPGSGSGDGQTG